MEELKAYKNADRIDQEHTHVAIHRDRPVIVAMGKTRAQCAVHAGIWLCNSTESPPRRGNTYADPFYIVGIRGRRAAYPWGDVLAASLALSWFPLAVGFFLLLRSCK